MLINLCRLLLLFSSGGAEAGQPVHDLIMLEHEKQKTWQSKSHWSPSRLVRSIDYLNLLYIELYFDFGLIFRYVDQDLRMHIVNRADKLPYYIVNSSSSSVFRIIGDQLSISRSDITYCIFSPLPHWTHSFGKDYDNVRYSYFCFNNTCNWRIYSSVKSTSNRMGHFLHLSSE